MMAASPPPSQPDQGILEGLTNLRQQEGLLASASMDDGYALGCVS